MYSKKNYTIKSFNLEEQGWLDELHQHGVVVLKNIVSNQQVVQVTSLFWDWMENLGSGLQRNNSQTWINSAWPALPDMGFFVNYGGAHTKASWFMRVRPRIKQVFAKIWNTNQLISSFGTFIGWRPWWNNPTWNPYVENLHCDQNPSNKKGFHCVQGMIALRKVDEVGGLMVIPDTNNDSVQEDLVERYPFTETIKDDWLELKAIDPFIGQGTLVKCDAGDLILWDSRLIHGGLIREPSEDFKKTSNKNELVRFAMTVSMTPKSLASDWVLQRRRQAFKDRKALTHWPHHYRVSGMSTIAKDIDINIIKFDEIELTEEVKSLIG